MKQILLLDHNSPTALHQQAEYQLRKLISDKKYAEGDLFQKEMELAKRWGTSINTLPQAFANLVRDGLLERKNTYYYRSDFFSYSVAIKRPI